jgi:transcriptional regulator with XRE-family HTH domain
MTSFNRIEQKRLNELGSKLRTIRESKNLSLQDLGYIIDKEPQSISRVENGKTNPTYLYLLELCRGLEIDISDLFNNKL